MIRLEPKLAIAFARTEIVLKVWATSALTGYPEETNAHKAKVSGVVLSGKLPYQTCSLPLP